MAGCEVGQGALFQLGFMAGLGDRRLGKPAFLFLGDHPINPLGRLSQFSRSSLRRQAAAAMLAATISPAMHGGED